MANIYEKYLLVKSRLSRFKDEINQAAIKSHVNCNKYGLSTMQQIERILDLIAEKERIECFIAVVEDWLKDNPEYAEVLRVSVLP